MSHTLVSFSQIKHLLPADCWAYTRNERNNGEFDEEFVALFEGDTRLEKLDLDRPLADHDVFLILVNGNLEVDRYIYNEETDGATCLIVIGDLRAQHIVVGGQELYVTGNMQVTELFWGDYNHGALTVKGNAAACVFADTEEYHVSINGELQFTRRISNWDDQGEWDELDDEELLEVFTKECLFETGDGLFMHRAVMLDCFETGRPVLITDNLTTSEQESIPFLFADAKLSVENVQRLAESLLMPEQADEAGHAAYEFWAGTSFYRVFRLAGQNPPPPQYLAVYLQKDQWAVMTEVKESEPGGNVLKKLFRQRSRPRVTLQCRWRRIADDETEWQALDAGSPEEVHTHLQNGWNELLAAVSRFEYYRRCIQPEQIRAILSLPVVKPYDDFYDDDKGGFWCGSLYVGFRQPGVVRDGVKKTPCFVVAREIGEDMEIFQFDLTTTADGTEKVDILNQAENSWEYRAHALGFWEEAKLKTALALFRKAEKRLLRLNQQLLAGEAPYDAEPFAIDAWVDSGYLERRANSRK